jgi:hypothetical protein
MKQCNGSFEMFPGVFTQGECGSAHPHDSHDFSNTARICPGAPAGFEADCGAAGPHDEHPYAKENAR